MTPEMSAQTSPKSDTLSFKAVLGILSSFPRKLMNTKVGYNFVAHNLDTEFALFGVRTWEIWCRQGRATNQENLDEADCMETKFHSPPRKIWCKARWSTPQGSPRVQIQPPRHPKRVIHPSIHQRAADTKEKHREEADGRRKSSSCQGDGLGHALAAMVGPTC
jgi:hypothetical protein